MSSSGVHGWVKGNKGRGEGAKGNVYEVIENQHHSDRLGEEATVTRVRKINAYWQWLRVILVREGGNTGKQSSSTT